MTALVLVAACALHAALRAGVRPALPPAPPLHRPAVRQPRAAAPLDLPERPRVLVSFGTHLPWAKADLVAGVRELARRAEGVSFVVSLGDPGRPVPVATEGRVQVHGFVPCAREVPRFDAVIHHGGAGVLGATVAAGRPALVCPQDFDQFDGAARVVYHGLGLRVRRLADPAAAEALRDLLDRPRPALRRLAVVEGLLAGDDGGTGTP